MKVCIILHNMIIDDEKDENEAIDAPEEFNYSVAMNQTQSPEVHHGLLRNYYTNRERYFQNHTRIRNRTQCHQLQHDLMEHILSLIHV